MEKEYPFQHMVVEKLDLHIQKREFHLYLIPYTEINSKPIIDLNIKSKIIKLLEENIRKEKDKLHTGKTNCIFNIEFIFLLLGFKSIIDESPLSDICFGNIFI